MVVLLKLVMVFLKCKDLQLMDDKNWASFLGDISARESLLGL